MTTAIKPSVKSSTRQRIIAAADDLFYRRGFEATSFSDIAQAVQISRGNFYHHFKSKDDILDAVISRRLENTHNMVRQWDLAGEGAVDRLRSFINILVSNRRKIIDHGCPVGTLCTELAKLNHGSQAQANTLLTLFRRWLRHQFEQLGRKQDADELAMHLLACSQGVATLANAFHDEQFIRQEVTRLYHWLDAIVADTAA